MQKENVPCRKNEARKMDQKSADSTYSFRGVLGSLPVKKNSDTLTPRGTELDLFARKVHPNGEILWELQTSKTFPEFSFNQMSSDDVKVKACMDKHPEYHHSPEALSSSPLIDNRRKSLVALVSYCQTLLF